MFPCPSDRIWNSMCRARGMSARGSAPVAECVHGLRRAASSAAGRSRGSRDHPHPCRAAAAALTQRYRSLRLQPQPLVSIGPCIAAQRHTSRRMRARARPCHPPLSWIRGRPDKDQSGLGHRLGELVVFRRKRSPVKRLRPVASAACTTRRRQYDWIPAGSEAHASSAIRTCSARSSASE